MRKDSTLLPVLHLTHPPQITDADLTNPEIVGIEAFTLIIHALLIVRYGLDVLKITAKKADPSVFT